MLHFFTHWTKKRIIICAISVVLAGTAFFGAYTMLGPDGGITDITPPDNSDNGTSLRPEGKTVADMTDDPKQNLYIANGVLSEAGSFKSETVGQTVSTKIGFSVTQDIYALRVVKGSTVYKQSSSYGLVKMGDERFAHGDTYLYRTAGDVKSVTNMKWPDGEPKKLEKDEFFERYGSRGNGLTGYILNDETIVSATYNGYDEATGLYSFTYVLDNQKATVKMLYEMRTNSGSKNFGTFEKAIITVTMDKDWVVRTLTTDCAYNVPIAGNTPCKEDMVETFSDIGKIDSYEQMPCHDYYNKYVDFSAELPADDNGDNDQPFTPALPAPAEPQPLDVLMGMFETYLDGTTPLNAKLTTKVKDFDIAADITLRLDLQNLANTTFAAITDGELRLTYANNNIYAAVNNIKLRSSVDDVMNIVKRYAGNSLPTDLGSLDIDPTAILESMSLQEVDGKVIVTIPLSLGKIELQATLVGTKNDDGTYAFAEATVAVNGIEIKLTAQDKTIETIAPDDSFVDACALFAMVEPYINGDPLNARLATKVKDFDIAADITLRLDLQNLANTTFAAITGGGLRLTYANNNIYAAVNNVKLRSTVSDIMNIARRYAGNSLPTDLGSLDIDATTILESMSLQEIDGKVIVKVPLSLGKIELEATLVGIQNDDGTYAFAEATVAVNGIEIKLTAQDKTIETITPDDTYINIASVIDDYADVISRIADTKTPDRTQTAHKSWTFTIDPVTIVADGQTYTTEAMTLHLYLSPSRIAVKSDPFVLTTKSADGKETKTSLLLGGAYELPTTKNDGKLYLTINDLINPTSDIKVSIGRQALVDCFNKRLPELLDAIPQLKELTNMQFDVAKLLDLSALLSELKYDRDNDKTLSLTIDASQIFGSLGTLQVTLSQPQDGAIRLSLAQQETTALTIQSLAITAAADSDVPTDEQIAAAYDTTQPHTSLDSIDTLLQSLINTAKRTSFRLTGEIPVNLSVIGIINADITIDLDIRIDVEKNENAKDTVYIAAKLSRGKLSGLTTIAFADKGGDSYLYYNGKDGTITLKRNSYNDHKWCKVCKNYTCTNGWHTGFKEERVLLDTDFYGKCSYEETVTEQQFVDNMFDYIMKLINFSDTINNTITGAINKDDKAEFGIDDILVAYNYDNPYYNLTLDLKPVDNVLGKVNVKIAHDEQYNLTSLTGDIQLLDITGVSAKGTFDIKLIDSEYGDAKQLTLQTTVF